LLLLDSCLTVDLPRLIPHYLFLLLRLWSILLSSNVRLVLITLHCSSPNCPVSSPKLSALSLTKEPSHLVFLKVVGVREIFLSNNLTLLEDTMCSKHCSKVQRSPIRLSHLTHTNYLFYPILNYPSVASTSSIFNHTSDFASSSEESNLKIMLTWEVFSSRCRSVAPRM